VKYFPGDFTVNAMVLQMADIFAYSISGWLVNRFQAKSLFFTFFIIAATAGLCIAIIGSHEAEVGWAFTFLVILAKLGISANFNIVYIAHAKMFPTLFAVTSMGIVNFAAKLSITIAPLVAEVHAPIPMYIFSVLTLATAFCSLCIKDESQLLKSQ